MLPDPVERVLRVVGDAASERARGILVKRAAGRIRRLGIDVRHFEGLGIVERRVAAAVVNGDRMVFRDLVEIVNGELPAILHFGVVEEIALHPVAGRRLGGAGAQLLDDAVDGDHLDFERIADQDFVSSVVPPAWLWVSMKPGTMAAP